MPAYFRRVLRGAVLISALSLTLPGWTQEHQHDHATADDQNVTTESEQTTTPATASPEPGATNSDDGGSSAAAAGGSHNPIDLVVYKPLWAVSRGIGDFNPIGKGISAPLEKAIRGFRFKGYINNLTQFNTTADQPVGSTYKDWLIQKQEERVQLEFRYQASEHIELVSVNHFLWDGAYALSGRNGGLQLNGSPNEEYYTQGKRIFREAYLRGNYNKVSFTLGRQIVNWGKLDGKVIDIINADDGRDAVQYHQGDYDWQDIGQLMAYVSVRPAHNTTISAVWNPDYQISQGVQPGSEFSLSRANTYLAPAGKPSGLSKLSQSEGGVRVDQSIGGLTVGGIYYTGYRHSGPAGYVNGKPYYTRWNHYGYALDYSPTILKHRFVVRSEGILNDPTGVLQKHNDFTIGNAIESNWGSDSNQISTMYEVLWINTPYGAGSRTGQTLVHVFDVGHSVRATSDRLSLETCFYVYQARNAAGNEGYQGLHAQYIAGWKFNDYVKGNITFSDYQGPVDTAYGAYAKQKNVQLGVKYEW